MTHNQQPLGSDPMKKLLTDLAAHEAAGHLDDDQLVAATLGHQIDSAAARHLAACDLCTAEVDQLREDSAVDADRLAAFSARVSGPLETAIRAGARAAARDRSPPVVVYNASRRGEARPIAWAAADGPAQPHETGTGGLTTSIQRESNGDIVVIISSRELANAGAICRLWADRGATWDVELRRTHDDVVSAELRILRANQPTHIEWIKAKLLGDDDGPRSR